MRKDKKKKKNTFDGIFFLIKNIVLRTAYRNFSRAYFSACKKTPKLLDRLVEICIEKTWRETYKCRGEDNFRINGKLELIFYDNRCYKKKNDI